LTGAKKFGQFRRIDQDSSTESVKLQPLEEMIVKWNGEKFDQFCRLWTSLAANA
jgi:hypothetical protein